MSDPALAVHKAVRDILKNTSAVGTAMGGASNIFDSVPAEPAYPYIRIGDDDTLPQDNSCASVWEYFHTLHIFARPIPLLGAKPLAKRIGGPAAAAILTLEDTVHSGFRIDDVQHRSTNYFMEKDGITAHGVMVCRFMITLNS